MLTNWDMMMPFQYYIDTHTEGVDVSLEVFNNTLTFYFDGSHYEEGEHYRNQWELTHHQFLPKLAYYNPEPIIGTDAIHLKKAHVSHEDVERCHIHVEFNRKIHPTMLSAYLNAFLEAEQTLDLDNRLLSPDENFEKLLHEFGSFYGDATKQKQEQEIMLKQQFNALECEQYLSLLQEEEHNPKSNHLPLDNDTFNETIEFMRTTKKRNYRPAFFQEDMSNQQEVQPDAKKNKLN